LNRDRDSLKELFIIIIINYYDRTPVC